MRYLILIRHSQSKLDPGRDAHLWSLTQIGKQRCLSLAQALKLYKLEQIITSTEPKAIETGRETAQHLNIPTQTAEGLHEHDRIAVPFYDDHTEFLGLVGQLFAQPDQLVFGNETANQALSRFSQAVDAVIKQTTGNIGIVTHGTVMSLFVGKVSGRDAHTYWQQLKLPAYAVFTLPPLTHIETQFSL